MPGLIEDYAVIGDTQTVALVCRSGSIDWLCAPRFDSGACFAALLGDEENGHWSLAPTDESAECSRRYVDDTLVLETEWSTGSGRVRVYDFMPHRDEAPDIVRIVEGVSGETEMCSRLRVRFDYGQRIPWVHKRDEQIALMAGPDALYLTSDVRHEGEDFSTAGTFTVAEGERRRFVLTWHESHLPTPRPVDADAQLDATIRGWRDWVKQRSIRTEWRAAVVRSLITLKALTYAPTGGIVAAATTSLPEDIGGVRNWDYRYCWLRDATWTLEALLKSGYTDEAREWQQWLLRAIAGDPADVQIMYGLSGERRLDEYEADWLPGYEGSRPVRIGNAASEQLQLDVYGEVIDAVSLAEHAGVGGDSETMPMLRKLIAHLDTIWREPDEGLWEVRGDRQQFTHSKLMCWVAYDRMSKWAAEQGDDDCAEQWRATADEIHSLICEKSFDSDLNSFTQAFGSRRLDAAVLMMLRMGFLPADDPRMVGTVEAIQNHLTIGGLVRRYQTDGGQNIDGLSGEEGSFIACSFWLAEALHRIGRTDEAREMFGRLLDVRNDVGLLAEEYDPRSGRQLGNFPQAFSHIGLVNTAFYLTDTSNP